MFVTADQLVAHAVGDYLLQSDWMATEKVKRSVAALVHVVCYTLPFLFLTRSPAALAFVAVTHFVIDRWRLARYVVWAKNFLAPVYVVEEVGPVVEPGVRLSGRISVSLSTGETRQTSRMLRSVAPPWSRCKVTGYDEDRPAFLAVWLLIIADNVMHVLCNAAALRWLA